MKGLLEAVRRQLTRIESKQKLDDYNYGYRDALIWMEAWIEEDIRRDKAK